MKTMSQRLKEKREASGLTVRGLAALSRVDAAQITRIETGQNTNIGVHRFARIADALRVDMNWLYARHGSKWTTEKEEEDE